MDFLIVTFFISLSYMYGSIPFALIFTYVLKREIIYERGTGKVGVANTFMVGGLLAGFLTVLGDVSKVILALIVSSLYFNNDFTISLVLIFSAILGTNFSVFLKGKGDMGTTMLIWTLAFLSPFSLILFFGIATFVFTATRDSYYTSVIVHSSVPVVLILIERSIPFAIFGLLVAILFVSKYRRGRDEFEHFNVKERLRHIL